MLYSYNLRNPQDIAFCNHLYRNTDESPGDSSCYFLKTLTPGLDHRLQYGGLCRGDIIRA